MKLSVLVFGVIMSMSSFAQTMGNGNGPGNNGIPTTTFSTRDDKVCGRIVSAPAFNLRSYKSVGGDIITYPTMKIKYADKNVFYVKSRLDGTIETAHRQKTKNNSVEFAVDFGDEARQENAAIILSGPSDEVTCLTFHNNIKVGKGSTIEDASMNTFLDL